MSRSLVGWLHQSPPVQRCQLTPQQLSCALLGCGEMVMVALLALASRSDSEIYLDPCFTLPILIHAVLMI